MNEKKANFLVGISAENPQQQNLAQDLAHNLNLPYVTNPHDATFDYLLIFTPQFLALKSRSAKSFKDLFHLDFSAGKIAYRQKQVGLRKELLARALGTKPKDHPYIIDATAGLGRDSFILAALGFHVVLIERSPIIYALLKDALYRAAKNPKLSVIIARMELILADANIWLANQKPDIVYLDPMFPKRTKTAAVKKEMVILQNLLGATLDAEILFKKALSCAAKRVVVKRPRLATPITELAPHFSLTGKNSRFDIYLTAQK